MPLFCDRAKLARIISLFDHTPIVVGLWESRFLARPQLSLDRHLVPSAMVIQRSAAIERSLLYQGLILTIRITSCMGLTVMRYNLPRGLAPFRSSWSPANALYLTNPNLLVAQAAPIELKAPTNRQTAIALTPSAFPVPLPAPASPSPASSACFPGSRIAKTHILINVPTNCGSVVYRFKIPRYMPAVSPVDALEGVSSSRSRSR